jgi:hypothetical protein
MATITPKAPRPADTQDATSPALPKSQQPLAVFRFASVSAAVFSNSVKTKNGQTVDLPTVSLRRAYRDEKGTWQHTHSLRPTDLLPASFALLKCFEFVDDSGRDEERQE